MKFQVDFQLTIINKQQIYAHCKIELFGGNL